MGHPQFFRGDEPLDDILVSQIRESAQEVSFRVIRKLTEVPRVSSLIMWYLAAYTVAPRFAVYDIVSPNLKRLLGKLGMSQSHSSGLDMAAPAQIVARNAAAAAAGEGWILRIPRPARAGRAVAGQCLGDDS
jgi:hypothetical protein